jgi:hypothetical protein
MLKKVQLHAGRVCKSRRGVDDQDLLAAPRCIKIWILAKIELRLLFDPTNHMSHGVTDTFVGLKSQCRELSRRCGSRAERSQTEHARRTMSM